MLIMKTPTYEEQLRSIDNKIAEHKEEIEKLSSERHKVLEKIKDLDMDIVLQCIVEKGLTSTDIMELINNLPN